MPCHVNGCWDNTFIITERSSLVWNTGASTQTHCMSFNKNIWLQQTDILFHTVHGAHICAAAYINVIPTKTLCVFLCTIVSVTIKTSCTALAVGARWQCHFECNLSHWKIDGFRNFYERKCMLYFSLSAIYH